MKKNKIQKLTMAIISAVLIIGIYLLSKKEGKTDSQLVPQTSAPGVGYEKENEFNDQVETKKLTTTQAEPIEENKPEERVIIQTPPSVELWKDFQSEAKLKLSIHPNYKLQRIELDDNVLSVYGSSPGGRQKLAVMAARGNFSIEQIENFINENKQALKFSNNKTFVADDKPQVFPGLNGSGISKITVLRGPEDNGRILNAAYIQRSDKQGSYLVLIESGTNYIDDAEGEIDQMYYSLKAE